jgi:hypothetical protein
MSMSAEEAHAWLARWKEVERFTLAEARALPLEAKFRQLETLMRSATLFSRPAVMDDEDERVRELWMRLYALNGS